MHNRKVLYSAAVYIEVKKYNDLRIKIGKK